MKKILFIILLMAICVQADEYVNTVSDGVIKVKSNLHRSTAADPVLDSVIEGYFQEGAMLVSLSANSKILFDTVLTTAFTHFIAFDTLMEIVTDAVFFSRDSTKYLIYHPRIAWDDLDAVDVYLSEEIGFRDRLPSHFDWDNGYIFLTPTPATAGDSLLIMGFTKPGIIGALFWDSDVSFPDTSDCTAACDSVQYLTLTDIAVIHRPAIVYYATACFATKLNLTERANLWYAKFEKYLTTINAIVVKPIND